MATNHPAATGRTPAAAGLLLGLALGGFFDGILLHQVLQWHHLLSNVDAVRDMRMQVLADGLFHVLMYLVAVAGLVRLWRARAGLTQQGAGRMLWGSALLGFGAWHVADAVLSHWLTGIHRIRVDSPNPLLWDLLWLAAFGLVPLVLGWRMRRGRSEGGGGGGRGGRAAAALGLAAVLAGPIAALPAGDAGGQVMVLFAPGVSARAAFDALAGAGARVLWVDRAGGLWAVHLDDPAAALGLYRRGALLVSSGAGAALGCFSWSRAAA